MPQGAPDCKIGRCWQTASEKETQIGNECSIKQWCLGPGCIASAHLINPPERLLLCMKDLLVQAASLQRPLNFPSNSPLISNCYQTWQTGLFSALVEVMACFKTEQTTNGSELRGIREMKMLSDFPTAKLELCLVVRSNLQGQKGWGKAMLQPSWMPATQSVTASTRGSDFLINTSGWCMQNFHLENPKRLTSHIPF